MEAKAMIKTVCKNMLYWADQMVLPRSDRTKPPIGVTMVQVSQVPKWNRGIYADQKAWQWFGFDQAPKWFCGLRPIKRRDWFRLDHVPKWSGGFRLSKGVALVRTRPRPQVISQNFFEKQISRGKPEAVLRQNLRVTTHDVKKNRDPALWSKSPHVINNMSGQ